MFDFMRKDSNIVFCSVMAYISDDFEHFLNNEF